MDNGDRIVVGLTSALVAALIAGIVISAANGERWGRACAAAGGVRVSVDGAYACAKIELLPVKVAP